MFVYIVVEESFRNEPQIVAVFSNEEAALDFMYENESDDEDIAHYIEEWSVDGATER